MARTGGPETPVIVQGQRHEMTPCPENFVDVRQVLHNEDAGREKGSVRWKRGG